MEQKPSPIPAWTPELEAAFLAQGTPILTENGCFLWLGPRFPHGGYGRFYVPSEQRYYRAHRVWYAWKRGDTELILDHLCHDPLTCVLDARGWCDHRICINPDHLQPTTRGDNVRRGIPGSPMWSPVGHSNLVVSKSGRELDYVDPRGWRGSRADRNEASQRYRERNSEKINAKRRADYVPVTYEPRPCAHCGRLFTPERSTGRMCGRLDCVNSRQRLGRLKRQGREHEFVNQFGC